MDYDLEFIVLAALYLCAQYGDGTHYTAITAYWCSEWEATDAVGILF